MKIFHTIESQLDVLKFQRDIDSFSKWCSENALVLNVSKCHSITFSLSPFDCSVQLYINEILLENVEQIRDLGVIFDSKLKFVEHYNIIISKAAKMLGFIFRACSDFNVLSLKILYCSFVRSVLEYASILWDPIYDVHQTALERIQKKFLRSIAYRLGFRYGEYTYDQILEYLNMATLSDRRYKLCLLFLNKLITGKIDCPDMLSLLSLKVPSYFTREPETFFIPNNRTNYALVKPINHLRRIANNFDEHDLFDFNFVRFKSFVMNNNIERYVLY